MFSCIIRQIVYPVPSVIIVKLLISKEAVTYSSTSSPAPAVTRAACLFMVIITVISKVSGK